MRRKKKHQVPQVLWKAYGNNVRTLMDTILFFLPPPPSTASDCRCGTRRCLGCCTSDADRRSFLLRTGDSADYHELLKKGFAFVSDGTPKIAVYYPEQWGEQEEIVMNTITLMMKNSHSASNVLCCDYGKPFGLKSILYVLNSSAWRLLLTRIGDDAMSHLLRFSSIFLALSNNHHQVTGPPLNNFFQFSNFSKRKTLVSQLGSENQQPSLGQSGSRKKKRVDIEGTQKFDAMISEKQSRGSLRYDSSVCPVTCEDNMNRKRVRPFRWQRRRKRREFYFPEDNAPNTSKITSNVYNNFNGKSVELSTCDLPTQSCRPGRAETNEFKQEICSDKSNLSISSVSLEETPKVHSVKSSRDSTLSITQMEVLSSQESKKHLVRAESEKYHIPHVPYEKMRSQCFYCLMLQAPQKVGRGDQINRQSVFYNSGFSRSVFPRNHILNRLKPNDSGASSLLRHIFGMPNEQMMCFGSNGLCPRRSECLYHSLLDLLKSLIRKSRRCQYLKLLCRHCSSLIVRSPTKGCVGSISKEQEVQRMLSLFKVLTVKKNYDRSLFSSNLPLEGHVSRHQEECPRKSFNVFDHQFELTRSHCKHKQVVSFIWAVCRNIVPLDLIGAPSNWRAFQRNISKFVQLRRFENFYLRQCTHGLKTSCFSFLSIITESFHCMCTQSVKDVAGESANILGERNKFNDAKLILKTKLFESWIFWFFSDLVVPIVCANFYVTESETGRQDIFYYRKPIWKKLMNRAISSLKEQSYRLLDHASLERTLSKRSFGFSKVRFLPKENGVRPLANLKAPCKALFSFQHSSSNCSIGLGIKAGMRERRGSICSKSRLVHFRSVNSVLRDLYVVLKRVKAEHPEQLGSSVFDYNDVYKKLCPFFMGLRYGSTTLTRVFVVICDVSKAFDTIDQDKLLGMMKDVINNDEYSVKRYARILCAKASLRIRYDQVLVNQSGSTDIAKCAAPQSLCSSHSVLVDQGTSKKVKRGQLYHQLYEHVKRNILQLGRDFYMQQVGIPQGSVLSSLLCSFYYACLERDVILPYLEKVSVSCTTDIENFEETNIGRCLDISTVEADSTCHGPESSENDSRKDNSYLPKSLLMRLIDDFIFLSTSERQAKSFFLRLRRGFTGYNCSMNNEKFCMNFDTGMESASEQESGSNRLYTGEDGISFLPWSGLLINSCTMEIQADYTRYLGIHMSSTITVSWQVNPGFHLKSKLCDYMRPKCHPIFYDSNINSPSIVRLNAYQAFLLCAMKFHCFVRAMPKTGRLCPNKYLEIIRRSIRYMSNLIKKRMNTMKCTSNLHPILRLKKNEVEWLGLNAYIRVLRKKQSRYRELLSLLRCRVRSYGRMEDTSSHLKYAVDDTHSSMFWKMEY